MRGIVVCVGYDDLLKITLPRNIRHLEECLVVTSSADTKTQEFVKTIPNCRLYVTDSFYSYGARFNKGLALEMAFDELGRRDWILIWDADILFPDRMLIPDLVPEVLYGARRRVLNEASMWSENLSWASVPIHNDKVWPGYFHLFHANDPHIKDRPWYDVTFAHAGGGDGYFQSRWVRAGLDKQRLPFEVLHLGPIDTNWHGRCTERLDGQPVPNAQDNQQVMDNYKITKGWKRGVPNQPIQERVHVPGYAPTGFKVGGT